MDRLRRLLVGGRGSSGLTCASTSEQSPPFKLTPVETLPTELCVRGSQCDEIQVRFAAQAARASRKLKRREHRKSVTFPVGRGTSLELSPQPRMMWSPAGHFGAMISLVFRIYGWFRV